MVLHLVNSPDDKVKGASYKMLSNNLSLVSAILCFHCLKDLSNLAVTDERKARLSGANGVSASAASGGHFLLELAAQGGDSAMAGMQGMAGVLFSASSDLSGAPQAPPGPGAQGMAIGRFALAFILLEVLLRVLKKSHERLAALGLIGAHFVGFVAADSFGTLQECHPWNANPGMSFVWAVISFVVMGSLVFLCKLIRVKMNEWDGEVDETEENWEHQCQHSEDEFVAFAMGLLITQVVRFGIMNHVPHFHGVQKNPNTDEVHLLAGCAAVVGLMAWGFVFIPEEWRKVRIIGMLQQIFAMTMAWSFVFWGKWTFWGLTKGEGLLGGGDVMTAQMVMATISTICGFMGVLVMGKIRSRFGSRCSGTIELFTEAIVLVIGLAWESVFMCAIYFANKDRPTEHMRVLASLQLSVIIVMMVTPAWYMHILPKAMAMSDHDHDDHAHDKLAEDHKAPEPAAGGRRKRGEAAAEAPAPEAGGRRGRSQRAAAGGDEEF